MRYRKMLAVLSAAALVLSGCSGGQTAETTVGAEHAEAGGNEAGSSGSENGNNESEAGNTAGSDTDKTEDGAMTALSKIDNSKWNYNAEDGVYWQVGISYCGAPADTEYETMGIFVPEAYFQAADNGDGTYTCEVAESGTVGGYTAATAPIVIPVNTPGYMSMAAPTDYVSSAADYTAAGFIYANAGCRGRNEGAPAGVTDLKAAVRYLRWNEENLPGDTDRIFTFGMSGGGAQSALMGATGDSEMYLPYLEAIGAVMETSDAVAGSMCWCPITNLDYANEAYEWNLGLTREGLTDELQALSNGMAEKFAEYINELELKDEKGNVLVLTESENGIYQAGSYYDYMKNVIETSLNHFLEDTEFPYTTASGGMGMPGGGLHGGPDRMGGGRGGAADGGAPAGAENDGADNAAIGGFVDENGQVQNDGINRGMGTKKQSEPVTYKTVQDYIDDLNKDGQWVFYDSASNTATITSVEDFVKACKQASKSVGAFDDLEASQGENTLFGYGDGSGAHFDPIMAELLKDNETYGAAYAADLEREDFAGNTVDVRMNMYNPMYYICDYYEGYQTANTAKYWRIRTGINQGDTALSTEMNLALALVNYGAQVDFETIWGEGHTMAERTGSSSENFIAWVNSCLGS